MQADNRNLMCPSEQDPWAVVELSDGTVHMVPLADEREHESNGCWCLPRIRSADDGTVRVLHNAEKDDEWPEIIGTEY